jgi:hypothetical protein
VNKNILIVPTQNNPSNTASKPSTPTPDTKSDSVLHSMNQPNRTSCTERDNNRADSTKCSETMKHPDYTHIPITSRHINQLAHLQASNSPILTKATSSNNLKKIAGSETNRANSMKRPDYTHIPITSLHIKPTHALPTGPASNQFTETNKR